MSGEYEARGRIFSSYGEALQWARQYALQHDVSVTIMHDTRRPFESPYMLQTVRPPKENNER